MGKIKWFRVYVNLWRIFPLYLIVRACRYKEKLKADIDVWIQNLVPTECKSKSRMLKMGYCIFEERAFVNVIQNRLHRNPLLWGISRILFKPLDSLYINMPPENIGGGYTFSMDFQLL